MYEERIGSTKCFSPPLQRCVKKERGYDTPYKSVAGMLISLPSMAFLGHSAHEVYDVLPVRCQTYVYLPSRRALPHGREAFPVPLIVVG